MRRLLALLFVLIATEAGAEVCEGPRKTGTIAEIDMTGELVLDDGARLALADVVLAAWPRGLKEAADIVTDGLAPLRGADIAYRPFGKPDAWGAVRAHVFAGETWVQDGLVGEGLARVAPMRGRNCAERLLAREAAARRDRRGIWRDDRALDAHAPDALLNATGTYQLVTGRVRDVASTRSGTYVNFGRVWRFDTTALITPGLAGDMEEARGEGWLEALEGRAVLLRGWIENKDGPLIRIRSPLQLRPIDG